MRADFVAPGEKDVANVHPRFTLFPRPFPPVPLLSSPLVAYPILLRSTRVDTKCVCVSVCVCVRACELTTSHLSDNKPF